MAKLRYGTVRGRFVSLLGEDGAEVPLTGSVTLAPLVGSVVVPGAVPPVLARAQAVKCPVVAGELCAPGTSTPGVTLAATDQPDGQPSTVQWRAVIAVGSGVPTPVVFSVPDGGEVDLSLAVPETPEPGTVVVVSHADALSAASSAAAAAEEADAAAGYVLLAQAAADAAQADVDTIPALVAAEVGPAVDVAVGPAVATALDPVVSGGVVRVSALPAAATTVDGLTDASAVGRAVAKAVDAAAARTAVGAVGATELLSGGVVKMEKLPSAAVGGLSVLVNGYVGDGVADDTEAVNTTMAQAAALGVPAVLPPGTVAKISGAAGSYLLTAQGVTLRSSGGTVLRVANGQPSYAAVIGSDSDVSGFTLDGVTIDQNKANAVSPSLAEGEWQFAVRVRSGKRITIRDCTFVNADGINTVVLNGGEQFPSLVENVSVTGCRFLNVGTDVNHDHSTIYTNCEIATIADNHFIARATAAKSAYCAIETHGSAHRVQGNHIEGYREAINATGVTYRSDGIVVTGNTIRRCLRGIRLFLQSLYGGASPAARGVVVADNSVILDPDFWAPAHDLEPQGIILTSTSDHAVHGLKIRDNSILFLPYSGSSTNMIKLLAGGIVYTRTGGTTSPDRAVDISGNTVVGALGSGILLSGAKIQGLAVNENLILDCASPLLTISQDYRSGITLLSGEAVAASVCRNRVHDFRAGGGTSVGVGWFPGGSSAGSTDGAILDNDVRLVGTSYSNVRVGANTGAPMVRHMVHAGTSAVLTADTAVGSEWTVRSTGVTWRQQQAPAGAVWLGLMGAVTTANRPSASAVGAGFMVFDATLGRPIWSNGSSWKDATGATV